MYADRIQVTVVEKSLYSSALSKMSDVAEKHQPFTYEFDEAMSEIVVNHNRRQTSASLKYHLDGLLYQLVAARDSNTVATILQREV